MKNFFKMLLTEPDNLTPCPVRLAALTAVFQALGLAGYDVIGLHSHFDLQAFGIGMGALLGATGGALALKKDTPAKDSKE